VAERLRVGKVADPDSDTEVEPALSIGCDSIRYIAPGVRADRRERRL
jgi:hypothetical protein